MRFEWDDRKAASNARKHGVSFEDATTVFFDPLAVTGEDPDHSTTEKRFITFGADSGGRLLVVGHADAGAAIRIITARLATRGERRLYEEG